MYSLGHHTQIELCLEYSVLVVQFGFKGVPNLVWDVSARLGYVLMRRL